MTVVLTGLDLSIYCVCVCFTIRSALFPVEEVGNGAAGDTGKHPLVFTSVPQTGFTSLKGLLAASQ